VPDSRSFATLLPAPTGSPQGFSTGFAEHYGKRMVITQRVVWDDPWKLVFNGFDYDELHNLERDPWEMDNLAQDPVHEGQLRAMSAQMWATVRDTGGHSLYNSHYPILRVAPFGPRIAQESTGRGGRTE
jgi:choline-sulfatase